MKHIKLVTKILPIFNKRYQSTDILCFFKKNNMLQPGSIKAFHFCLVVLFFIE